MSSPVVRAETLTPEQILRFAKTMCEDLEIAPSNLLCPLAMAEELQEGLLKGKPPGWFLGHHGLCRNLSHTSAMNWLVGLAAQQFSWCCITPDDPVTELDGRVIALPKFPIGGTQEYIHQPKWEGKSLTKRRELLGATIVLLRGLIECLDQKEGKEHAQ